MNRLDCCIIWPMGRCTISTPKDRSLLGSFAIPLWALVVGMIIASLWMGFSELAEAAPPAEPEVSCVDWAYVGIQTVKRCTDESTGEYCIISTSGMFQCKLD